MGNKQTNKNILDVFSTLNLKTFSIFKGLMSKGPHADKAVCANCQHMTTGNKCDHCKTGFFGGAANGKEFCQPCDCNGHGDICNEVRILKIKL